MNPIRDVASKRLIWAGAGALLGFALLVARLGDAALVHRAKWVEEAERQQQRTIRLAADRGSFLDREGRTLAVSVPAWSAWADPSELSGQRAIARAARQLASVLDVGESVLRRRLSQPRYFVWLERKLDPQRRARVERLQVLGVGFVKESRRSNPQGELAAHVLGSVGMDDAGLEGLEYALQDDVAGTPGLLLTMRDARGDDFLPGGLAHVPPAPGSDVVLTIDSVVQHVAERELRAAVSRTRAAAGTVIVMFPGNGDVLAQSNLPTFHPNNTPTHPSHLRTNRAVASCYEPGSTLKIFTVAAALESRLVRPSTLIDCGRGSARIGSTKVRDHEVFDVLTVAQVLEKSSNVGAIRIGQAVGAPRLERTLARFGFGRKTGVGCPGESAGILRPVASWTPLSLATISFGQEIAVTPLQLATATCAVSNGGFLPKPRLVAGIRRNGAFEARPAAAARRVLSRDAALTLASMLEGVVERGTGKLAAVPGYRVAGKTGTAQKIGPDGGYLADRHVASFVGWAPARDPAILVLVVLDEPQGAFHGGEVAAPVFAAVARDVLRYLQVPPELPRELRIARVGGAGAR